MSVKIIADLHPFKTSRVELTAEAKTIAEIIAQLNSGFPPSQARVSRNGEIVADFSLPALDGDTLWIKFVPAGSPGQAGAGMKVGGWALAFVGAVLALTGYGSAIGVALIGSGIGMIAGGAVLMNTNIPSFDDKEKPENDPSIRGGKNQSRPHGRIPVLFGRHRVYPDLAANPYTSIIDGDQYLTQLFCGGYKDCVIDLDSFKLGETPLVELSQTKSVSQILAGADPVVDLEILQNGETSRLYPYCVHEDAVNAPLQNKTIIEALRAKISEVLTASSAEAEKEAPGDIIRTTPDNTDTINVDIFLFNGIGQYNKKGELESASVEVRASYKKEDDSNSPYVPLGFFNNGSNVISGAELKTKRFQITKSGLPPGRYTVMVERVTPDSKDSKVIDQVYVGSIRSIKSKDSLGQPVRPIRGERQKDLTVIALRVMATSRLNGVVDSFNYVAASKLPVYSGSGSGALCWLASAETRNPAAMLLYALRGRAAQQRVDPGDVDWRSLEEFYAWCGERNYTCNAYLSESVAIAELLRMIGGTARADVLRIDSKISVVQDVERQSPVQLFTPKNTKSYGVTMFNADVPDAAALRFVDEQSGYAQNEAQVFNTPDGNKRTEPETVQKIDLWGVTDSVQARRIGMYNYACLKNRPFVHTIEVDIEYLMCDKGDWIQYAGDIALTGSIQGRVIETLWSEEINRCVGVRLDEPVETEPGRQYAVRIRLSGGTVLLKDIAAVREPNEVYFTEPLEESKAPRRGDVYAFGVRGREVVDLIITDIQPQADFSAALTCVEYSPAIFGVDDPDFLLPEFENKITPVSGAIDSGVVGTAGWRLFVAYHDGEEEPPRPAGDGQDKGWHYAHTSSALWQSSKTAESVDSGEWGPPARIKGERGNADVVPVYLTLSPQTKILECDSDGNVLAGLLPFASQAVLFKWNFRVPVISGIERFPGADGGLFDPMLGDFVPTARGINFSLANAPAGVSIDREGKITVSADAELEDEHSVAVQAEYEGAVYSAALFIQVKKRAGEAKYLGTIETLPQNSAEVFIIKGRVTGRVRALQANYVLAVAGGTVGGHTWQAGRVYQWTGIKWEYREPENHSDLYISCFKDGLDVPSLTQDMGWFGALFTKLLVAQQAFIEELQTKLIRVENSIFGGPRFTKNSQGQLVDNGAALNGFKLGADGRLIVSGGTFDGKVEARSGEFVGGIAAGGVWDINGNLLPGSNNLGGIWIPEKATLGKIREMLFDGTLAFAGAESGMTSRPSVIQHYSIHTNKQRSATTLHAALFIEGRMTYTALGNLIAQAFGGWDFFPSLGNSYTPLSGSVIAEMLLGEIGGAPTGPSSVVFILSAMRLYGGPFIRLYGINTKTGANDYLNLTGNNYITASFTIL